jgi:hypothetical protein
MAAVQILQAEARIACQSETAVPRQLLTTVEQELAETAIGAVLGH